mmetsp:Transcript_16863/g.19589  ORF Transcript_16863/g.19589 Transcript_16863/m.19589 type:complete len:239 (+) Transcript_16863:337-1053(+)
MALAKLFFGLAIALSFAGLVPIKGNQTANPKPNWPRTFFAKYESDYKFTTGTYAVDVRRGHPASERIYFKDGTYDHLCGAFYNNTSCIHLTTAGHRYLIFPNVNFCCRCCSYASGSYLCGGPLSPKWVSNETGNLQYLGIENVKGNRCHKWNAVGLKNHPNYYYQYVASGLPCEVDGLNYLRKPTEKADDQYIFDEASFKFSLRQGYFQVPRICKSVKNCGGSVCYNPEAYHNVQMTA